MIAEAKKKKKKAKRKTKKKSKAEAKSRGLAAVDTGGAAPPENVTSLVSTIEADGGRVLASYREPMAGHWQIFAALPIDKVVPTPFQRDVSKTHAERLAGVIDRLDRFVDPIVAVRGRDDNYWSPNGGHRLAAMNALGAKSIMALVLPDAEVAYQILALNTEKAHNVKEKSLEVIRMARLLAEIDPRPEEAYASEFEEPSFLTMGVCYEQRGRFAGGAYQSVLKRVEGFSKDNMPDALVMREARAARVLALDDAVAEAVAALKDRGFESPYLKNFVVARVNPLRFKRGATGEFEEVIEKMIDKAQSFDVSKVKADQVASAGGG